MHEHDTTTRATPSRAGKDPCCEDVCCATGMRNLYYPGKRLSPHSYSLEQKYQNERRWLLNRAIH